MNKVYVGNLPFTITEDELQNTFEQFGAIDRINLITDRNTGKSKGFAFVTYTSDSSAQAALQFDGTELNGRKVRVSLAREKESISR